MATIGEWTAQLGCGDQVQEFQARQALFQMVWHAGNGPQRHEGAEELAAELTAKGDGGKPKHSARVRGELCRFLSKVASDAQTAAVAGLLADAEVREMARWSLDRIRSEAATAALLKAAESEGGTEFRVGAVRSLGERRYLLPPDTRAKVLDLLRRLSADKEPEISLAAIESLANYAHAASSQAIASAAAGGTDRAKKRLAKARVRLGGTLLAAGQKDAAKAVFQAVAESPADEPQHEAASRALAEIGA